MLRHYLKVAFRNLSRNKVFSLINILGLAVGMGVWLIISFLMIPSNRQYQADLQFQNLFTAFSLLAIFIACLGLFALVSFSAALKVKEIGVRKVLGAENEKSKNIVI